MKRGWSLPCGSIAGIPIRVHVLVPILAVTLMVSTPGYARAEFLLPFAAFLGVLVASVLLHELGHAFVARHHHLDVTGITIWPLGGLCHSEAPRSPRAQLRVALAGVAVSFSLGLLAAGALLLRGDVPGVPSLRPGPDVLAIVWNLNVGLGLFNLLPGLPLDGGSALEALLWRRFGRPRARMAMLATGALVGAGLLVGGIANEELLMAVVGGWVLYSVVGMYRDVRERSLEDETLLGVYDFSRGYTSLDEGAADPDREVRRRNRRRARASLESERRVAADEAARASSRERLDGLLDRIASEGISALSDDERAFLDEESRRLRALRRGRSPTRP